MYDIELLDRIEVRFNNNARTHRHASCQWGGVLSVGWRSRHSEMFIIRDLILPRKSTFEMKSLLSIEVGQRNSAHL